MAELGVGLGVRAGRGSCKFHSPSLGKLVILKRKSKGEWLQVPLFSLGPKLCASSLEAEAMGTNRV